MTKEIINDGNKKMPGWLKAAVAGMAAAAIAFGPVGCTNDNAGATSGGNTPEAGQTGGETGVGSGPITEGPGVTIGNPTVENNPGEQEQSEAYKEMEKHADDTAQDLLESGHASQIIEITIFPPEAPDGCKIFYKGPSGENLVYLFSPSGSVNPTAK